MTNRVERELMRLYEKLNEKYDFAAMKKMYTTGSLEELREVIMYNDDILKALRFWFDVRIRKSDSAHETRPKKVTSDTIVREIYSDLGITLSHRMVASMMSGIVSKDDILQSYDIDMKCDTTFLFINVELVEWSELAQMKIFIAQPMSGAPNEVVEQTREKVTELMKDKYSNNIEIIDQFHELEEYMPEEPMERPGIYLLGRSVQFLADVDHVVFVGDFLHDKCCCVELAVCKEFGIPFEVCNVCIETTEDDLTMNSSNEKIDRGLVDITVDELGEDQRYVRE